jgi:hypothetical protein
MAASSDSESQYGSSVWQREYPAGYFPEYLQYVVPELLSIRAIVLSEAGWPKQAGTDF